MTKFFAVVACLGTFIWSAHQNAHANDLLLANSLKTKQIVRLKLWYEGIETSEKKNEENQKVREVKINEQLGRILNKVDL